MFKRYIYQALAEDIGNELGCGATVKALRRERSGDFTLDSALDGKELQTIGREELLKRSISI